MVVKRRKTYKKKHRKTKRRQHGGTIDTHEANKLKGAIDRFFSGAAPTLYHVDNQRPLDLFKRYLEILSQLDDDSEYLSLLQNSDFKESVIQLLSFLATQGNPDTTFKKPDYTLAKGLGTLSYSELNPEVVNLSSVLLESIQNNTMTEELIVRVKEFNSNFNPWGKNIRINKSDPTHDLALMESGTWKGKEIGKTELAESQEASQQLREGEEEEAKHEFAPMFFNELRSRMINMIPEQYGTTSAEEKNTTNFYSILVPHEVVALHFNLLNMIKERGLMEAEADRFENALRSRSISQLQIDLNDISSEIIAFLKNLQHDHGDRGEVKFSDASKINDLLKESDENATGYDLLSKIVAKTSLNSSRLTSLVEQIERLLWSGWSEKTPDVSRLPLPVAGSFGDLLLQGGKALNNLKQKQAGLASLSGSYDLKSGLNDRQILSVVVKDVMNVIIKNILFLLYDFYSLEDKLELANIELDNDEFEGLVEDSLSNMIFNIAVSTNYAGVSILYDEPPPADLLKFTEAEKKVVTGIDVRSEIDRNDLLSKRKEMGVEGRLGTFGVFLEPIENMITRNDVNINLKTYNLIPSLEAAEVEMDDVIEEATPQQQKTELKSKPPSDLASDAGPAVVEPALNLPPPSVAVPVPVAAVPPIAVQRSTRSASKRPASPAASPPKAASRQASKRSARSPTLPYNTYGDGAASGYGYGDGAASGYGYGDGAASGYGYGDGAASGYGYGDGAASGYGDEYGSYGSPRSFSREGSYDYGPRSSAQRSPSRDLYSRKTHSPSPKPATPKPGTPKPGTPKPGTPKPGTPAPAGEYTDDELDGMKKADLIAVLKEKGYNVEDEKKITCADAVYAIKPGYSGKKYKNKKGKTNPIPMKGGRRKKNRTRKNKKRKTRRKL